MTRVGRRLATLLVCGLACTTVSEAYYHFIRFAGRTAPWQALPEKFDLNALPNRTLSYFIADQSAVQLSPYDTFAGLLSQIRSAAQAWNNVETSDLRLAFGGSIVPGTAQTAPTLEVLFEEVPPGFIAMGGATVRAESNGRFVPILKSVVILRPDMTQRLTYTESFHGTLVHEFGHAIGLQHALTSSVMSTVTRATSKARPLTADDVAGISLLYPSRTFAASTGSITGRVVLQGGQGVNLASVVAISPAGAAISTLTNPDGTFRIEGLPPRSYYVYVHPLPPPVQGQTTFAGIVYPTDQDGRSLGPGVPFDTVFFRAANEGTAEVDLAAPLTVSAGSSVDNINFLVRPRNQIGIHSVEAFAYPNGFAVKPAYLSAALAQPFLVVRGEGLTSGAAAAPGLRVQVLNGPTLGIQPFATPQGTNLQLYFDPRTLAFSTDTPRHLVFSLNNDMYVLPSGFFHVERQPPVITGIVAESGSRLAVITGLNLRASTQILFDGVEAPVRSFDEPSGRLLVAVPPAAPGHRANVTALNTDGQSSLFAQGDTPPVYTYTDAAFSFGASTLVATPSALPAGTESMIQIDVVGSNFIEGLVSVGFGTSDIAARRVWVLSPTRLLANVAVGPLAMPGVYNVTIASGMQVTSHPMALHVQPANPRAFWLTSSVVNVATQQRSLTAGALALLTVGNSPVPLTNAVSLFLGDIQVPVLVVSGNDIGFQVPANMPAGPVIVRVEAAGERSTSIVVGIEGPSTRIATAPEGDS